MSRVFSLGGIVASIILIAFGLGAIIIGAVGRSDVTQQIEQERITGSPDMSPDGIRAGIEEAGLDVEAPTCDVADEPIDSGSEAKCFAEYLRIHALESTGGRVYAEMGQFLTEAGEETSDPEEAATDPETGRPVPNAARNTWVTATALSTALNTSYFAQQVALFSIVMGIALLLTGIGFLVLTLGARKAAADSVSRT
jgi:hypothetical protein